MINDIKQSFLNLVPATPEPVLTNIIQSSMPIQLAAGEHLLHMKNLARFSDCIYQVQKGLLRCYILKSDGREFNTSFINEGQLYINLTDNLHAGQIYIQAMEPTVVMRSLCVKEFRQLARSDIHYSRILVSFMQQQLAKREERAHILQLGSAVERYAFICNSMPSQLIARIPQYHLATYLGLNAITLSRAKKEYLSSTICA